MRYLCVLIFLVICQLAKAEPTESLEFDFGQGQTVPEVASGASQATNESTEKQYIGDYFSVPFRGVLGFDYANQFDHGRREIRQGPRLDLQLDWQGSGGLLFADSTYRYNNAYDKEADLLEVRHKYRNEIILREAYYRKSFKNWSFSAGRIITVWGKADALVVTDVISPRDQSEFFFARPKSLRLGQSTLIFDFYLKNSEINLLYIPVAEPNRHLEPGHPYAPLGSSQTEDRTADRNKEEVGLRWNWNFENGSQAVLLGHFHRRDPIWFVEEKGLSSEYFERAYPANPFFGYTIEYGESPIVFKSEIAFQSNRALQRIDIDGNPDGYQRNDLLAGVLGIDYTLPNLGVLTVEVSRHRPFKESIDIPESQPYSAVAAGWTKKLFRDDLELQVFQVNYDSFLNSLTRLGLALNLSDDWVFSSQASFLTASPEDGRFQAFKRMDRFDVGLEYFWDLH